MTMINIWSYVDRVQLITFQKIIYNLFVHSHELTKKRKQFIELVVSRLYKERHKRLQNRDTTINVQQKQ